jgi:ectoine hydroxylase-related dioxygenase (phytanoyl-CoA dioxygenase family)
VFPGCGSKNRPEATEDEEGKLLSQPCFATQWNAALYDDECLLIVPGSHNRPRTADERRINLEGDRRSTMPGYPIFKYLSNRYSREKRVMVRAGSVLFYDHNILHRATYPTSPQRGAFSFL